jgi:predicted TIM-barrel fold metal-dependent hydrolase
MTAATGRSLGRREFLGAVGAGVGAAAVVGGSVTASAQATGGQADGKGAPLKIIDFHNHYVGPGFALTTLNGVPSAQRAYWEGVNRNLADPQALLASVEGATIAARVINTPTAFLQDVDGNVLAGTDKRINDQLADLASKNEGRLYAMATVDAFSGDGGARELTRAVRDLGLRGVCL